MPERLQKILARSGYGSRRACEDFISAGRVRVNGQIASVGQKADASTDKITVDGKPIAAAETLIYIALYKPRNVLSTVERERGDDRQTVRDIVDVSQHIHPVGRLDFESEGLVLMTNDGDLTNRLTHPRYGHEFP
jgi:23S rRNA pseudouridine2605 synthase